MESEQWKAYGLLQISDTGQVREKSRLGWQEVIPIEKDDILYISVKTSFRIRCGFRKLLPVAGLVLATHSTAVGADEDVAYLDGNFRNCAIENLIKVPKTVENLSDEENIRNLIKDIECLPGEEWKLLDGITAACSNRGRFVDSRGLRRPRPEGQVELKDREGRRVVRYAAWFILYAFKRPPQRAFEIAAFKDGNKRNIHLDNLFWRDRFKQPQLVLPPDFEHLPGEEWKVSEVSNNLISNLGRVFGPEGLVEPFEKRGELYTQLAPKFYKTSQRKPVPLARLVYSAWRYKGTGEEFLKNNNYRITFADRNFRNCRADNLFVFFR